MIVVKITDGLGNQMFQYAYAKFLEVELSKKVYLDISDINKLREHNQQAQKWNRLCDKREYKLNSFSISLPIIDEQKAYEMSRQTNSKYKFINYCDLLRLLPIVYLRETDYREVGVKFTKYQDYYIEGYFFDKRYSETIGNILKREFRPKEKMQIPEEMTRILKTKETVSLHIRRGDFLRVGRNISEDKYYEKAIQYLKNRLGDIVLFIFSDDIEWVKANKKFEEEHFFISDKGFSDNQELFMMSLCRHNITANSTFSYWGAWLNSNKEKVVISPKGWKKKIIPESWFLL